MFRCEPALNFCFLHKQTACNTHPRTSSTTVGSKSTFAVLQLCVLKCAWATSFLLNTNQYATRTVKCTTKGNEATITQRGTCLPAPVSEKKVLKASLRNVMMRTQTVNITCNLAVIALQAHAHVQSRNISASNPWWLRLNWMRGQRFEIH